MDIRFCNGYLDRYGVFDKETGGWGISDKRNMFLFVENRQGETEGSYAPIYTVGKDGKPEVMCSSVSVHGGWNSDGSNWDAINHLIDGKTPLERTLESVYAIRPDMVIVNRFNYSIAWMEQPQEGLGLYHSGHFEPCEELGFEVYNHVQQQVYALNQETGVILKVDKAGTYLLTLNVVTNTNGPVLQVFADGQPIGEKIVMSNTAGAWRYESLELAVVTPEAGDHVLSFRSVDVASDASFILDNLYLNEINPAETDEPTTDEPAPDDYFTPGTHRGAIKERWFSSVICAMNGPAAAPAAAKGVTIENHRSCEPLVLLKHFPVYDGMPQ